MPNRPARPRPSAHHRGYGNQHRRLTALAIHREPWCHTIGGCPEPDAGTPANPLTGGHPLTLAELSYDAIAWNNQPRIPQCRRCNTAHRPLTG